MIKTIIVDDDFLVRSYLKTLSAWERAGFEITADLRDGEEALRVLKAADVDLVITDISMPLMDGIELIKRIRLFDPLLYIIVLSCHDDFESVKEAMREGADEYILKNTLDEGSLYELLAGTEKKIEEKQRKKQAKNPKAEHEKEGVLNLKYLFFNRLLSGGMSPDIQEQERKRAGIRGRYQNSAVVNMFLEAWQVQEERTVHLDMEQYCQSFYHRLSEELKAMLFEQEGQLEMIYLGAGVFCCFLDLSDMRRSSVMRQRLTTAATACYKICQKETYRYRIGVSNVCIGTDSICEAYQQAREMMKLSFYDETEILYYDMNKKSGQQLPAQAQDMLNQLDSFVHSHNQGGLLKAAGEVLKAFEQAATERRFVIQWLKAFEQQAGVTAGEDCNKLYCIQSFRERLLRDVEMIFQTGNHQIPEEVSRGVRIAAEFAMKHYKEPIGLNEAAGAAGMNPTYLSYLFKQEMKVGFAIYLLNCRMECAKKMLEDTNLKVREVAEKSGFNDYHYFAKAFKKMCGVSPAEYRKGV